jgi:monoamine oxidase
VRFTILEARRRIGGRMHTLHVKGFPVPIELGAEFTHGEAEEVLEIAERRGLRVADIAGRRYRSSGGKLKALGDFWERLDHVMRRLDDDREPDRTFAEAVAANRSLRQEDRALALQFVQGFHAANPSIISERALADGGSPRGDVRERRIGRVLDGYGAIVDALADGIERHVRYGSIVRRIEWEKGSARIHLIGGRSIDAAAVIITVPLGVLAAQQGERGAIAFDPAIPAKRSAISDLAMGTVTRIGLRFDEPFWASERFASRVEDERLDILSFIHGPDNVDFPIWWTTYPVRSSLLVGWCGGPKALSLAGNAHDEVEDRALRSLAKILSMSKSTLAGRLVSSHTHDWMSDPFSRGVYSYARVGGDDAAKRLARPVDGTLFFAGEAADVEGRNGTVHGAIGTGRRAADLIR